MSNEGQTLHLSSCTRSPYRQQQRGHRQGPIHVALCVASSRTHGAACRPSELEHGEHLGSFFQAVDLPALDALRTCLLPRGQPSGDPGI